MACRAPPTSENSTSPRSRSPPPSLRSGIVGSRGAPGIAERNVPRNLAVGFGLAALLHATFNYLILSYGNIAYTIVLLVIVGFFVLNDFERLKVAEERFTI